MKVALSTRSIEPALVPRNDGIGVYTAALMENLPKAGVSVEGFAFAMGLASKVPLVHSATMDSYATYVLRDFPGIRKRLDLPVDIVHYTDHMIVPSKQTTVATLHDAVPLKYPDWVSPRMRTVKNFVMKRMARHADHVVAVSRFAVDELVEHFGVARERIHVVPNGISLDWLACDKAPKGIVSAENGQALEDYFLFVGTFQPRKNLERVLQAYLSLPEAVRRAHPFVIVGRAGWRCDAAVAEIEQAKAAGHPVFWLRDVQTRSQLQDVYRSAHALVFASLYEGFGIPMLEAFACDIPVISSTASSLPEVAGEAALFVDPYRVDEIREAMLCLAESTELRTRLVQAGAQRVQNFTWMHTAQAMAGLYARL